MFFRLSACLVYLRFDILCKKKEGFSKKGSMLLSLIEKIIFNFY